MNHMHYMKKDKFLILFILVIFIFSNLNITANGNQIKYDIELKDYNNHPFETTDTGFTFRMKFEVNKNNQKFTEKDYKLSLSDDTKTKTNIDYEVYTLYDSKEKQTIEYIVKTGFFVGSIDLIPEIKGNDYKEYAWYASGWNNKTKIILNHSMINSDLVNFPILFKTNSFTNLSTYAQNDGDDIFFTNSDENLKFAHEIEYYNTGDLIAWINITEISSSIDTTIWMYYNNPTCNSQTNKNGVWDSNYVFVNHLSDIFDSTGNGNSLTPFNGASSAIGGKIYRGYHLDGYNDYLKWSDNVFTDIDTSTIEIYFKLDDTPSNYDTIMHLDSDYSYYSLVRNNLVYEHGVYNGTAWNRNYYPVQTGKYYYVVNKLSGLTSYLYFDGKLVDSIYYKNNVLVNTGNNNLGAYTTPTAYWDGYLDEVRYSKIARSDNWINTSYNTVQYALNGGFYSYSKTYGNQLPVVSGENPVNNSVSVSVSLSQLTVNILDDWTNFNYTIECSNGDTTGTTNQSNDTYILYISDLKYSTEYFWYVNVTEYNHQTNTEGETIKYWFKFTTETPPPVDVPPEASNFFPVNNSYVHAGNIDSISCYIYDQNADIITYNISMQNIYYYEYKYINKTSLNGTIRLNLTHYLMKNRTYQYYINLTSNNNTTKYTITFYTHNSLLNVTEGGMIEFEATQFGLIIQIILFIILTWMGYKTPEIEVKTNRPILHSIPFIGGLYQLFASLCFIGMIATLTIYLSGIIITMLGTIGIILLIHGILKTFWY